MNSSVVTHKITKIAFDQETTRSPATRTRSVRLPSLKVSTSAIARHLLSYLLGRRERSIGMQDNL